jgi:formamidopyrimidine-DNA glycosylase
MPELPEVETVVRQLAALVRGRVVRGLRICDRERLRPSRPGRLRGRRIRAVHRLGKQIVLDCEAPDRPLLHLAVHLRMTGRLLWRERAPSPADGVSHLRALLRLDRGALAFCDTRRFGTLQLAEDLATLRPLGFDPLQQRLTAATLGRMLQGSPQQLKTWLLRQDRLVGLGNIYAAEILHRARLHPCRVAATLTPAEVKRLRDATVAILRRAVEHCGTTFSDFQGAHGVTGAYQRLLAVYGREGEPCPRCGAPVARLLQQQRSTFYCRRCQGGADPPHSPNRGA